MKIIRNAKITLSILAITNGSTAPPNIAMFKTEEPSSEYLPKPSIPIVKMQGNKMELNNPTKTSAIKARSLCKNINASTSEDAISDATPIDFLGLILVSMKAPINRPAIDNNQ